MWATTTALARRVSATGVGVGGSVQRWLSGTPVQHASSKVVITGGAGNIGTKVANHLVGVGHDVHVLDPWAPADPAQGATYHQLDYLELNDEWVDVIKDAHAVVHFACFNPYPEASWSDVAASMLLTQNLMNASAQNGVGRFINASSNHVMGGYKDLGGPYAGPGIANITPMSPPEVGTKWDAGGVWMDSTGYATAKLASEVFADHLAQYEAYSTQFITVRIGWCQPGVNRTNTMSAGGTPTLVVAGEEESDAQAVEEANPRKGDTQYDQDLILDWYRLMWLSNRDCCQVFEKAIDAHLPANTPKHVVVNGMSNNTGMRWSLDEARGLLGYEPVDDAIEDVKHWKSLK